MNDESFNEAVDNPQMMTGRSLIGYAEFLHN